MLKTPANKSSQESSEDTEPKFRTHTLEYCERLASSCNQPVSISLGAKYAVVISSQKTIDIYNVPLAKLIKRVQSHPGIVGITTVIVSKDETFFASGHEDNLARVWSLPDGELRYEIITDKTIRAILISPDNQLLFAGTHYKNSLFHLPAIGTCGIINEQDWGFLPFYTFDHGINLIRLGSNGLCLVTTPFNYLALIQINMGTGTPESSYCFDSNGELIKAHLANFSLDGSLLFMTTPDDKKTIRGYRSSDKKLLTTFLKPDDVGECVSFTFATDNSMMVALYNNAERSTVCVWRIEDAKLKCSFATEEKFNLCSFSLNNKFLYSVGPSSVRIWDTQTGKLLFKQNTSFPGYYTSNDKQIVAVQGGNKSCAIMQTLNFPLPYNPEEKELWVFNKFMDVLRNPELLSVDIIHMMFEKVEDIFNFKLVYTLANVERQLHPENARVVNDEIYKGLELLAERFMVRSSKDSKEGAKYVAAYKLILDSAELNNIITPSQKYYLDSLAEDHKTFSDKRFMELNNMVSLLQQQVEINTKNIKTIADDIQKLKMALKKMTKRDVYFGIIRTALSFFGGGLVSLLALRDLSDMDDIGNALLQKDGKAGNQLLGSEQATNLLVSETTDYMLHAGYDPDEFVKIWAESKLVLKPQAVATATTAETSAPLAEVASTSDTSKAAFFKPQPSPRQSQNEELLTADEIMENIEDTIETLKNLSLEAKPLQKKALDKRIVNLEEIAKKLGDEEPLTETDLANTTKDISYAKQKESHSEVPSLLI